jgi:predicted  nucleic acid-binding Zn-ribbon protein
MVRTSTIIVIVICTIIVAVGGLSAFYFKSHDDAAAKAEVARENAAKAEAAKQAAEQQAAAARANTQNARSAYELAEEQLELAKLSAASSKFTTDAEKSKAEADLIVASRALEEAAARLQEAETNELITDEELKTARDNAAAAQATLDAAEEAAKIVSDAESNASDIIALGEQTASNLSGEASDLIAEAENTGAMLRDIADGICRGTCPGTLKSQNTFYKVVMQNDGNLVIHNVDDGAVWSSETAGQGTAPYKLVMQDDGNLVIYDVDGAATWNSGTAGQGTGPYRLVMQNDRNLVIFDSTDTALWSSGTTTREFSIRGYNTNADEDGGGNVVYLDRQHVNCGDDALTRFQLTRPSATTISYRVHCMEGVDSGKSDWKYTNADEDGGGNMVYLDRQKVDCGDTPITDFLLRRPTNNTINYAFKCSNLPHNGNCRELVTPHDEDGGGNTVYLDRQNVECGEGEAMTSFRLTRNATGDRVNYTYTCCTMPE